jgi:hypothetical protein
MGSVYLVPVDGRICPGLPPLVALTCAAGSSSSVAAAVTDRKRE